MNTCRLGCKAFSLIELLVSLTLVGIAAVAGWQAVSMVSVASDESRRRTLAENLITLSQEEVRMKSLSGFFPTLESCTFLPTNICGFQSIGTSFPGYTRTLTVTPTSGSELKNVEIGVTWTDRWGTNTINSVMSLARPADPSSGDIAGLVTDCTDGSVLVGANVKVARTSGETHLVTTSSASDGKNYTFAQSGVMALAPGSWKLKVLSFTNTTSSYFELPEQDVVLNSATQEIVNVCLNRIPRKKLTINLVKAPGATITPVFRRTYSGSPYLYLHENGSYVTEISSSSWAAAVNQLVYNVDFPSGVTRCFTVDTMYAWRSGLAGNFTCTAVPVTPNGWSSAQVNALNATTCANGWDGSAATDRVCVDPSGGDVVFDLPLINFPTATVHGVVKDSLGNPIPHAAIYVRMKAFGGTTFWKDATVYQQAPALYSAADGSYSTQVPALGGILGATNPGYYDDFNVYSSRTVNTCCGQTKQEDVSGTYPIPRLDAGADLTMNIVLNTASRSDACGDAQGNVIDDYTGFAISGAAVQLQSISPTSNVGGLYTYTCPGYKLVSTAGSPILTVNAGSNYWPYTSAGNSWYKPLSPALPKITASVNTAMPDIRLWPRKYGKLMVKVRKVSGEGVSGINLYLTDPDGVSYWTGITDASGQVVLDNITESWPPLINPPTDTLRYKLTAADARNYSLTIPGGYLPSAWTGFSIQGSAMNTAYSFPVKGDPTQPTAITITLTEVAGG